MQLLADGNGRHVHALCRKHGTGEQAICTVVSRADKHADPYVMRVKGSVFYDLQDLVRRGAMRMRGTPFANRGCSMARTLATL